MRSRTLKSIRFLTGNQWRRRRMGDMWSDRRDCSIILVTVFWMRCSLLFSESGRQLSRELHESSREMTNAWTSFFVVLVSRYIRICPILRMAAMEDLQMFLIWVFIVSWWSMLTPKFLASADAAMLVSPTIRVTLGLGRLRNPDEK